MKFINVHYIIIATILFAFTANGIAQVSTTDKRERRKNMTVKEWNTPVGSKTPFLDHITTYDNQGRKIEEIEYTTYGMKYRCTYEYGADGRCSREVEYSDRNKVARIRKFEYYSDGTKKKQYNYYPSGKLESVKEFEYIFK